MLALTLVDIVGSSFGLPPVPLKYDLFGSVIKSPPSFLLIPMLALIWSVRGRAMVRATLKRTSLSCGRESTRLRLGKYRLKSVPPLVGSSTTAVEPPAVEPGASREPCEDWF